MWLILFDQDGILLQEDQVRKNGRLDFDRFNMSFPIMHVVGRKVDLGINLHGVTTWTESKQPTNTSSNVKEARVISMLFIANKPALWDTEDISIWEREVSRYYHGYSFHFMKRILTQCNMIIARICVLVSAYICLLIYRVILIRGPFVLYLQNFVSIVNIKSWEPLQPFILHFNNVTGA